MNMSHNRHDKHQLQQQEHEHKSRQIESNQTKLIVTLHMEFE